MEGSIAKDTAGWRDHSEEGRKDRLRLLQLVKFDERVEKSNSDENATEISVRYVILRAAMSINAKGKRGRKGSRESRYREGCTQEDQK